MEFNSGFKGLIPSIYVWRCSLFWNMTSVCLHSSIPIRSISEIFIRHKLFTWRACRFHAQTAIWRTRISLLFWVITFDLSGMGAPASSYATAVLPFRILQAPSISHFLIFLICSLLYVSIPDNVIGIFHWHNPSGRTMALGLTQPLTEMSTRNISWG